MNLSSPLCAVIKTGESGLTVFRLLTKENRWKWVQANARLVYKNGKPDYIIATQRPLLCVPRFYLNCWSLCFPDIHASSVDREEEGGEHLRKRSMHLPFTYATGEALLYQSNHPVAGFKDGSNEKNSAKSKKSRTERLARDGVDPGSLLGAMMSQDESVYVCQAALEPKVSFHSSFYDQMGVSDPEPSWADPGSSAVGQSATEPAFDPLLATLDSLTLEEGPADGDGGCSNGELFGALEGLGLSAEDLELLLLDERMIRVEMDPEHVPSLDDLLTNDEILSYIYDSIEGRTDDEEQVPRGNHPTSEPEVRTPPHRTPILQLSQQMQQHLSLRADKLAWGQQSPSADGQWAAQDVQEHFNHGLLQQHFLQQQGRPNGLSGSAGKSQWQDYGFTEGQKPLTNTSLDSLVDFDLPDVDNVEFSGSGNDLFRQQHAAESTSSQGNHKRQQDQVISSLPPCQILGVGKSCRQLELYSVVTSEIPHDPAHCKVSEVRKSSSSPAHC